MPMSGCGRRYGLRCESDPAENLPRLLYDAATAVTERRMYQPRHDGPGVGILHLSDRLVGQHAFDLGATVACAWDELCDKRPGLATWYANYLPQNRCHLTWRVTDREGEVKVRRYKKRDEVVVDIPVTAILGAAGKPKIVELLLLSQDLRAEINGTPEPPT